MYDPYLIPGLNKSPSSVRHMLALIPNASLDIRHPNRFTPREALAHLADLEALFRQRMEQAVQSPGSAVEIFDDNQRCVDFGYGKSDPDRQMIQWEAERRKTVSFLEGLAPREWELSIRHPDRGELSVFRQAYQLLGHDTYHIEQFSLFLQPESTEPFITVEAPELEASSAPVYQEFMQTRSLSVGIYQLPAGSQDAQVPHLQDELYFVLGGKGFFEYEGQRVGVESGTSLFVAAEKEHRFVEIEQELRVLVVFSTPAR